MHPLIELGGYQIPAYSLCAIIAALSCAVIAIPALRKKGLTMMQTLTLLLLMCAAFLVGARLWNVAVNPWNFTEARRWYSLSFFGLSLYGGFAGAALMLLLMMWVWKHPVWPVLDAFVIPAGVAFAIARVGCFLNGCCAGKATDFALGVVFPSKEAARQALAGLLPFMKSDYAVHPTQLYELFGALVGLPLAVWLSKRLRLREGGRFLLYEIWFCTVRLAVLPLRVMTYSPSVKNIIYPAIYIALIMLGIVLLFIRQRKNGRLTVGQK